MGTIKFGSADPDNFMFGSSQVDKIYRGSELVWTSFEAPSQITDFVADETISPDYIEMQFTSATGNPTPQHDLYLDGVLQASNISPGHQYTDYGCGNFYVVAWNEDKDGNVHDSVSNMEEGCRQESFWEVVIDYDSAFGDTQYLTDNGSGNWTFDVPQGHNNFHICMIGGGGGGAGHNLSTDTYVGFGGRSGDIIDTTISGDAAIFSIQIGLGGDAGMSQTDGALPPDPGEDTTLNSLVASGGLGGDVSVCDETGKGYLGMGDPRDTCAGTFYDGIFYNASGGACGRKFYGGQAGFGHGGAGATSGDEYNSYRDGIRGAGGGGRADDGMNRQAGYGGKGCVIIRSTDWTPPPPYVINLTIASSYDSNAHFRGFVLDSFGSVDPTTVHTGEAITELKAELWYDTNYKYFRFGTFSIELAINIITINGKAYPLQKIIDGDTYFYELRDQVLAGEIYDYFDANVGNTVEISYTYF